MAKTHSLSMEVENVKASGRTAKQESNLDTDVTNVDRTLSTENTATYQVEIRNFAQRPDEVTLEWYFLAKGVKPGSTTYIHDTGKANVTVPAGETSKMQISSKPVLRKVKESVVIDNQSGDDDVLAASRENVGAKPAGWIVRIVADGKLLLAKASEPTLESVARDSQRFEDLKKRSPKE